MRLPGALPGSLGRSATSSNLYTRSKFAYSYAVGGLPFLSAATNQEPIIRETAQIRKQQFDSAQNPGEQSLDGWWLRSQISFHGGAGQLFGDPVYSNEFTNTTPFASLRFLKSRGVDVWTAGQVTLLDAVKTVNGGTPLAAVTDMTEFDYGDGTPATFAVAGSNYALIRQTATTVTAFTPTSTSPLQSVTTDGSYIYVSTLLEVWSAPIPASAPGTWTWTKEYDIPANTKPTFLAFVKSRIMLTVGGAVYELAPHSGGGTTLPTAKYTSPDSAWVWTGITEVSSAIYVVGNNGVRGSILKFVLDNTNGTIPTLTAGAIAAQLPSGEVPYSAMGYLGSYVGIGTNLGVRVAVADNSGNLSYGPILFSVSSPVKAWTARDRFLWCVVTAGNDGDSGLYRVDLSQELDTLRFPYATDLVVPGDTTTAAAVANLGSSNLMVFATATDTYIQDPTTLVSQGYLQTSRIRFNTVEPKLYKLIRVRGPVLSGALSYIVLDQGDHESGPHTFPELSYPGASDAAIDSPSDPQDFISVKFLFNRAVGDVSKGAEMWAYQLKALPGSRRQRMIQLPMFCFDFEVDRAGARSGGNRTARARLAALEALEATGNTVTLQDFDADENVQCVIDRLTFRQSAPPSMFMGWGGIITITLRTVD